MSEDLHHECGIAALYWLDEARGRGGKASRSVRNGDVTPRMPSVLLDLQNRGQLAAGLTSYAPGRPSLLETYKDVGTVIEAFGMSHPEAFQEVLARCAGRAAIGHTRYATCGQDDVRYAQPFERHHGRLWKWFSFGFNGQLANYSDLRDRLLTKRDYHVTLGTDTEIVMHSLAYRLRGSRPPEPERVMASLARVFDGAYNLVFLDAAGRMFVARDPLGMRPLNWAVQGRLFAAASESVALSNLGFDEPQALEPGQMAIVEDGRLRLAQFARRKRTAHCFFEWVYFSNVASEIDGAAVYNVRHAGGQRLAEVEDQPADADSIVVPVPDTAKAAADAFAYHLGIPCLEGLIRNRYVGRTFIQPQTTRSRSAKGKYTPLPHVLAGKRVFLVEDSIVRSTTLAALTRELRSRGGAREIHVRVACPPIVAPCFYGIDMSTLGELFAPKFAPARYRGEPAADMLARMAEALGVDSLRYLTVGEMARCLGLGPDRLCLGCVTGRYPTAWGQTQMRRARAALGRQDGGGRTYE